MISGVFVLYTYYTYILCCLRQCPIQVQLQILESDLPFLLLNIEVERVEHKHYSTKNYREFYDCFTSDDILRMDIRLFFFLQLLWIHHIWLIRIGKYFTSVSCTFFFCHCLFLSGFVNLWIKINWIAYNTDSVSCNWSGHHLFIITFIRREYVLNGALFLLIDYIARIVTA